MRRIRQTLPALLAFAVLMASSAQGETSVWASAPKPVFPQVALSKGSEGYVIVRAYVDSSGIVTRATISKKSGDSLLDDTARTAVLKWRMKPAAIKPEYRTSGYPVRFDFRQETPVAFKYRDRAGYFSTYEGARMWKYASLPEYPIHERGVKARGTTMVGITIGPSGEVVNAQVVKTSGYPNLDKSALTAIQHWRARQEYAGRRMVVPVHFEPSRL